MGWWVPKTSADSVVAAWAACSVDALSQARSLDHYGVELSGRDVSICLRMTKSAAAALGQRLLLASTSDESTFDVLPDAGRPEDWSSIEVVDRESGLFVHPLGAWLSIEVQAIPPITELVNETPPDKKLFFLNPLDRENSRFRR